MSQLYADLTAKFREHPETCYVPPARLKVPGTVVFKHLDMGDRGQALLILEEDESIWVVPSDQTRMELFSVEPSGKRAVPDEDAAAVLAGVPLPQPNSMWAYARYPGGRNVWAFMYWRRRQPDLIASRLDQVIFTLNGYSLPVSCPTATTWLSEIDTGWLRCIDDDLARSRKAMTFSGDPDWKGRIQLTYQGLDYRLNEIFPGPARSIPPSAGNPEILAAVAAECAELRDRAVAVLVSAKAA
jgi:hypothetical protein